MPAPNTWFENMVAVYLTAREYLEPVEAARRRIYNRDAWIAVLLSQHSRLDYLRDLAELNHAAIREELASLYQERFMTQLAPGVARIIGEILAGRAGAPPRRFLARQMVLRAIQLVLAPPDDVTSITPDPALVEDLARFGPDAAAVFLVHLAADADAPEERDRDLQFAGTAESLVKELIANSLFNGYVDDGGLLSRSHLLWNAYGSQLGRYQTRRPPIVLLNEATGLDFNDLITLGISFYAHIRRHGPGVPIELATRVSDELIIEPSAIERFLTLFSSTLTDLETGLAGCPEPWQMWPIQERPLLRVGDSVIVLDELFMIERVTQGLYWLVHDYEKENHGERARLRWTQAYGEMIEARAEDQLRRMAPPLLDGGSTFFTEERLQSVFPGTKNCDAGIDFGDEAVLAEVVSGTVRRSTRELGDLDSFREDTEKLVLKKVRQLDVTALNLLRDPQPPGSPLLAPPRRIFPVIICGGQFPVNPVTIRYIKERVAAEGLLRDNRVRSLGIIDLQTLDACESLHLGEGITLLHLMDQWIESPYAEMPLYSYLVSEFSGHEMVRPADAHDAISKSFAIMRERFQRTEEGRDTSEP